MEKCVVTALDWDWWQMVMSMASMVPDPPYRNGREQVKHPLQIPLNRLVADLEKCAKTKKAQS